VCSKTFSFGRVGPFWRETVSSGRVGPFWRVRSILAGSVLRNSLYVGIQCKQTDRQTTFKVYRVVDTDRTTELMAVVGSIDECAAIPGDTHQ
jgi:hypothetical protein